VPDLPYGNSTAVPFEKKYFSGGANSIRAWQVRSLGPGSFDESALIDSVGRRFPNSTADIKLEANIEYRFNLFWLMEGALFLDAGNIWAITRMMEGKVHYLKILISQRNCSRNRTSG
jgi:outer membrane protein assembly factor BamA